MYFRRLSVAFVSGLVASGAWYAYHQDPSVSLKSYSTPSSITSATETEPVRKALIIDNGQLYTAKIPDGPITKTTDDSGREIIHMMSPEQVTERLRRSEESYFVGRGKGVVRYDIVQLPSNDPIEDDHAEKIVTVPSGTKDQKDDWMFWGVFDGHSYGPMTFHRY